MKQMKINEKRDRTHDSPITSQLKCHQVDYNSTASRTITTSCLPSAEALEKVASKFLEDMDMEDEVRRNCVLMCGYFHESVRLVKNCICIGHLLLSFLNFFKRSKSWCIFVTIINLT